ncbi:hypothetical protein LSH36_171g06004 [Paralvinella palmiformis]|uniref:Uncharacterized protein n=1 Tax=Paralvinella palmiformis TaxID=53620 RepID=A0AAD9JSK9_9ANNE|nr:hypothetical protein LSH36_171g06004 [Paralvinella palmiformis]
MIETYKLIHGLVDSPQFTPLQLEEGRYTRGHCFKKLKKPFCRTVLRQHVLIQHYLGQS